MIKAKYRKQGQDCAEIWIEDELVYSVHPKVISGLKRELFSSKEDLDAYLEELEREASVRIGCKLLEKRARHAKELQKSWEELGIQVDSQKYALEKLKSWGYIDDAAWTERVVSREARQGHGPNWVRQKLQAKGIFFEASTYGDEEEEAAILRFLERPDRQKMLEEPKGREKLCRMLLRRGFSQDKILRYCKVDT